MAAKEHNFAESLALSHEHEGAPWWADVYRTAFPTMQAMVSVRNDGWAQRGGIDRVLTLGCGRTIRVDEKVRAKDWPDILVEYWSDYDRRVKGWAGKDLACDYIAYAFIPSQTCYLLPFHMLRSAFRKNSRAWWDKYRHVAAKNNSNGHQYTTMSVAVPIDVLMDDLRDAMLVRWKS